MKGNGQNISGEAKVAVSPQQPNRLRKIFLRSKMRFEAMNQRHYLKVQF